MTSNAGVIIKIMPDSPDADLSLIESEARKVIENNQGIVNDVKNEPVAFGLSAVIITFSIIETFEQDPLTDSLKNIEHVSSAEIIDFRRIGF